MIPVPDRYLNEFNSLVRRFLLPFWSRSALSTLCLPRKLGGVSLVDIKNQSFSLHLIYLQSIIKSPSECDTFSP